MLKFFRIPQEYNCYYFQFPDRFTKDWEEIDYVDHNGTVVIYTDSTLLGRTEFSVIYMGRIQHTGGSGTTFNPRYKYAKLNIHQNEYIRKHARHMSKWNIYSYNNLLKTAIRLKYNLIKKIHGDEGLPCIFYWNLKYYNLPGLLIGQLDDVILGKLPKSTLEYDYGKFARRSLLT